MILQIILLLYSVGIIASCILLLLAEKEGAIQWDFPFNSNQKTMMIIMVSMFWPLSFFGPGANISLKDKDDKK